MCQCVEKLNRQVEGPNISTFACVLVSCVCICIWYCNLCLYCVCRGVEELNWQDEAAMYYLKVTHGCGLWCPPSSHVERPDKSKQTFLGTLQNKKWNHLKANLEIQGFWINKYYWESYRRAKTNMKGWMKGFKTRIVSGATSTTWGLCSHFKELKQCCVNMFIVQHEFQHWNLFDQVYHWVRVNEW